MQVCAETAVAVIAFFASLAFGRAQSLSLTAGWLAGIQPLL